MGGEEGKSVSVTTLFWRERKGERTGGEWTPVRLMSYFSPLKFRKDGACLNTDRKEAVKEKV